MKKLFTLLVTCLPMLLIGCKDSPIDDGKLLPVFNLETRSLDVPYSKGNEMIVFDCNTDWTASCEADWIELSHKSGSNVDGKLMENLQIKVSYQENTGSSRSASILLTAGGMTGTVAISQASSPVPSVATDLRELTFKSDGTAAVSSFNITTVDADWTVKADKNWLAFNPESGRAGQNIKIDVTATPTNLLAARNAIVTVGTASASATVTVTQTAADIGVSVSELVFASNGGIQQDFTVKSAQGYSVACDVGWLKICDSTGAPIKDVAASATPSAVCVTTVANFEYAERTGTITVTPIDHTPIVIFVKQSGEAPVSGTRQLPAIWELSAAYMASSGYKQTFEGAGYVKTSNGAAATISYVRAPENLIYPVKYTVGSTGHLLASVGGKGDYWLFDVPVESLPAGDAVHITFVFRSSSAGAKYFMLEYLDNGVWKNTGNVMTATEDPTVEYNYSTYKDGDTNTRVDDEIVFTQSFSNESIKIRLRNVSYIRNSNGAALNMTGTGTNRIAGADTGTSPIIRHLGPVPSDSKRILFIGNSYTYYNLSPYLFKEIAWREGHRAAITMCALPNYSLNMHLTDVFTVPFIQKSGYDLAILQDGSSYPARIGTEDDKPEKGMTSVLASMQTMIDNIKQNSPSMQPVIVIHWGRKNGYDDLKEKYEFFRTYEAMQDKIIEGCKVEMEATGAWGSPVGVVWKKIYAERPDLQLFNEDGTHPTYLGSYLSAVVNYLTVYGKRFGNNPANCQLDPQTAAYIREVAESVVIGREDEWNITR